MVTGGFDPGRFTVALVQTEAVIRSPDRRLMLTERGRKAYAELSKKPPG